MLIKADLIVNVPVSWSDQHQDEPDDCRSLGDDPQSRGSPWGPQGLLEGVAVSRWVPHQLTARGP